MENNPKKKNISPFRILTLVLSCAVFLFAAFQLYGYLREEQASARSQDALADAVTVIESAPVPTEKTVKTESEEATAEEEPTLPPISYEIPIRVDFDALQQEASDTVAWLYCADTLINNAVVQGEDNEYYVYRLPDGTSNANGSLFMDFRNTPDLSDRNTIIYGHNMQSGNMFGTLTKYKNQAYYDAHPTLWLLTAERAYRVDLIAGLVTASDSDAYEVFDTDEEFRSFLEAAVENSTFASQTGIDGVDRIVTLSTCSYEYATARYVLIGSLTPAEYPAEAAESE